MVHPSNKVNNRLFLQLQQVSFRKYQAPLFRNLNWEIQEGETWAITGPSGSGKTLLAEALAGRYRLLAGKILYHFLPEPENIWELPKYVALISFQPQASTLNYGHYYYQQRYNSSDTEGIITVAEFLQNATSLTPQHPTWSTIIQQLHLEDLLGLAVIKLSNGQTRKMLIARALL
ncbi:MAG: ATP-binding cassette protein, partial [Adhaeribacter sp.]|nr:ATP-binding cassette protein [Adhaeribacter sp.]